MRMKRRTRWRWPAAARLDDGLHERRGHRERGGEAAQNEGRRRGRVLREVLEGHAPHAPQRNDSTQPSSPRTNAPRTRPPLRRQSAAAAAATTATTPPPTAASCPSSCPLRCSCSALILLEASLLVLLPIFWPSAPPFPVIFAVVPRVKHLVVLDVDLPSS